MYFVEIDGYETREFARTYFRFRISLDTSSGSPWVISRRYSDFVLLRESLKVVYPELILPKLPPSSILSYFSGDEFKSERSIGLLEFLRSVLRDIEPDPKSTCFREFLSIYRPCAPSISLRDTTRLTDHEDRKSIFSEDVCQHILSCMDAPGILKCSGLSRTWYFSSLSPILWHRIRIASPRYEHIQRGFISFMDRLSSESVGVFDSVSLHVQFTPRENLNLRMSLPDTLVFQNLKTLDLSSLFIPSDSLCTTEGLFGEILECILSNPESIQLSSVSMTTDLNLEILRSLVGISTLHPLTHLKLSFLRANLTIEAHSLLVSLLETSAQIMETCDIRVHYSERSIGAVPDEFAGERTSTYHNNQRFLAVLPAMTKLTKFHYDFFPKTFSEFDSDILYLPPKVDDIDIRFVVPAIGNGRDMTREDRRSLFLEILRAVPQGIRKIRLRTVGVDESEMMNQTDLIPYMFLSPNLTFDLILPRIFQEWNEKLLNLVSLDLQGPYLIHPGFWRFILQNQETQGRFTSIFSKLEKLTITYSGVSEFPEDFVAHLLLNLPRLQILSLVGMTDKLTDNLLLRIADPTRDSALFSRIWQSGFRSLTLPLTRYMSSIGIGYLNHTLAGNKRVSVVLEEPNRVTGREEVLNDRGNKKFIFTRF